MDTKLWELENHRDFLTERRRLLAQAANSLLEPLGKGQAAQAAAPSAFSMTTPPVAADATGYDEELLNLGIWVEQQGYPGPEISWELPDADHPPPTADLAWPTGVQQGLSTPLALIREDNTAQQASQAAGYHVCPSVMDLSQYLKKELGLVAASA